MQVGYRRSRHEPCMAPRLPSLQHSDAWHLWLASASRLPKDPYVPPLGWSNVFCQEAECWSKWMPPRWVLQNPPENLNEESANGPRMWSHNTFQHETSKVAIEPSPPSAAHPAHQLGVAIDGWPEWYTPSRDSLQDRPIGKRSSKVSPVNIGCKECTRSCWKVDIFISGIFCDLTFGPVCCMKITQTALRHQFFYPSPCSTLHSCLCERKSTTASSRVRGIAWISTSLLFKCSLGQRPEANRTSRVRTKKRLPGCCSTAASTVPSPVCGRST